MTEQTLHCRAGHTWTRPLRKGPRPQWCPDHHPKHAPKSAASTDDMANARAAKLVVARGREASITEEVEGVLANSGTKDELRRKLAYCQRELGRDRDDRDHAGLVKRRNELLAEVRRHLRSS